MCGIAGIFSFDKASTEYSKYLEKSISALIKNKNEKPNLFIEDNIAFAYLKNTQHAENQNNIVISDDKNYLLLLEGDIFYTENLKNLINNTDKIKLKTDSEILLFLLIEHGESIIEKLNGNFVFAFFNKITNTLIVSRDYIGFKNLFFYKDDEKFIFSTELKSILQFDITKEINSAALFSYLQLNYILPNVSIIKNINKLGYGSFLKINKQGFEIKNYYKIIPSFNPENYDNFEIASSKLRQLLSDAIEDNLAKHPDASCFLSGGIDSSLITALASKFKKNLNTFSIGYKDVDFFDETQFAELVAQKYNTNHTSFKITNQELLDNIDSAFDNFDEPFADSSALALNILSKHVSQHSSVVLSGDGADEMFAGYNKHSAHFQASYPGTKEKIAAGLNPIWKIVPKSRSSKMSNLARQLDRFATGYGLNPNDRYWFWATIGTEEYAKNILKLQIDYSQFSAKKHKYINQDICLKDINNVLLTDMNLVLQGDMLIKVSTMSAGNRLKIFAPFLDKNIIDYSFSLPSHFKINSTSRKRILKNAFNDLLPDEIFSRPKHGFEVPLLMWFKKDLKHLIEDKILSEDFIKEQGIFNYKEISSLKQKLNSPNPHDSPAKIWAIIVFQKWWTKHM